MAFGYKTVIGIGVCPKCNVIYKLRKGQEPKDGIHKCRKCSSEISDLKLLSGNNTEAYSW